MGTAKRKQEPGAPGPEMTFEAAMERLEGIVEEMEGADLPLEKILQRYEEGSQLRLFCESKLRQAEDRVKKIRPGPEGGPVEEPFEDAPDSGGAAAGPEAGASAPDEGLLL